MGHKEKEVMREEGGGKKEGKGRRVEEGSGREEI